MDNNVEKTSLYNWHRENSNNIVSFSGFLLPVYYSGIVDEHLSVRKSAGLFDVSHMGEFIISGKAADKFLQLVTVNDVSKLRKGQAQYTAICDDNGGIIDDIIIYKKEHTFMMVVNASNIDKNFQWLKSVIIDGVEIDDISQNCDMIAIQGPASRKILQSNINEDISSLKFYHFIDKIDILGHEILLSRTGYSGELGYEIYCSLDATNDIWSALIEYGKSYGLVPAGLGCRDTLRLEMNYLLYGNDINQKISPIEAGLSWITKLDKDNFIGKHKIIEKNNSINRYLFSFIMLDRAIPRHGYNIIYKDELVGNVTSGTMSPSLNQGIGMGYIDKTCNVIGKKINIDVRGKLKEAEIIKPPFYKNGSLHS
ncbi:MAG: glycine cleavage system protein T [bacterium TMED217]|nr:MAG: glycine cleavage system protein T [bacterium TMED217]